MLQKVQVTYDYTYTTYAYIQIHNDSLSYGEIGRIIEEMRKHNFNTVEIVDTETGIVYDNFTITFH